MLYVKEAVFALKKISLICRALSIQPKVPELRNEDKWYENVFGKFPNNPRFFVFRIVSRSTGKSGKRNGNSSKQILENLGIPSEVFLFPETSENVVPFATRTLRKFKRFLLAYVTMLIVVRNQ